MTSDDRAQADVQLDFNPFSPQMIENPYPTYRALRAQAPVRFNEGQGFWSITRYANVRTVLKDSEVYLAKHGSDLYGATGTDFFGSANLVALDPPDHGKIRRILSPTFTPPALQKLEGAVQETSDLLLDALVDAGDGDLIEDFARPLPIEAISLVLGVSSADRPWVGERVKAAFKHEVEVEGLGPGALEAGGEVREFFGKAVEERRKQPREDLLTEIGRGSGVEGEPLDAEEIGGLCLLLFAAGAITTTDFIGNSLYVLADQDELRRRFVAEPENVNRAVEELWRYESPIQNAVRTAASDHVLGGEEIKTGEKVVVFPGSANRDELVWEASEELDFDRDFARNLVFGDGAHTCVGQHLARLEGRIALQAALSRIPDYSLAGSAERVESAIERGFETLPITVSSHT